MLIMQKGLYYDIFIPACNIINHIYLCPLLLAPSTYADPLPIIPPSFPFTFTNDI